MSHQVSVEEGALANIKAFSVGFRLPYNISAVLKDLISVWYSNTYSERAQ